MADSNIVVSGLTASGGVGQIVLAWSAEDASELRSLPYMQIDKFEIWSAATSSMTGATKVGEAIGNQFVHSGLSVNTTRYYRVRARDRAGNLGDYSSVVSATTGTTQPPPNSVGESELQNNAVSASKIQAGAVTAAKIDAGAITAEKIDAAAVTAAKIAAGAVTADKISVNNLAAISATLGNVLINGNLIVGGTIIAGKLANNAVVTDNVQNNAITDYAISGQGLGGAGSGYSGVTLNVSHGRALVMVSMFLDRPAEDPNNFGTIRVHLQRDGSSISTRDVFYDDNFAFGISFFHLDGPSIGGHSYSVQLQNVSGNGRWTMRGIVVCAINLRK